MLFIVAAQWQGMTEAEMVAPDSGQVLVIEIGVPGAGHRHINTACCHLHGGISPGGRARGYAFHRRGKAEGPHGRHVQRIGYPEDAAVHRVRHMEAGLLVQLRGLRSIREFPGL